jgi:AcrR family transcriptional regulator
MPPKTKITKQDIIETALSLLREGGESAVNARSIASALGCSTQPIFSNFSSMEELEESVTVAAYECYLGFLAREAESGKYPAYKSFGMAYIRFAKEERELFKHLFMCDRRGKELKFTSDFDESVEMIMKSNSISREKAQLMHLQMWVSVHGIAAMLATSFLEFETELISDMLTDIYQGIRARHTTEEN